MSEVKEQTKLDAAIECLAMRSGAYASAHHYDQAIACDEAIRILSDWPKWEPLVLAAGKVQAYVEREIQAIDDDERYHYPSADVFTNAPLALIQTDMEGKMMVLKRIRALLSAIPANENEKEKAKEG